MSGHSKWHQIRRQKGVNDAKRGQLFTRLGRELVVAVREGGGGDPDANFRLRMAIQRARAANMPMDNIDRTIKRATGAEGAASFDEIVYEGYAPGGAAIMIQAMTDNRNRTVAEVRNAMSKNGGNLGEAGCVDWIFEQKGVIEVALEGNNPDDLTLMAIDAGAEDVDDAFVQPPAGCTPHKQEDKACPLHGQQHQRDLVGAAQIVEIGRAHV